MRNAALTVLSFVIALGAPAAQAQYTQKEWPEGPSKARFVATCDGCHDINRVRVGYTAEGWLTIVRMMQNAHAPVPAEEWGAMTDYLIRNFPERSRPEAAIIDGPVKANILMWDVPTQGSRPHDPLAARDGSIWWTGQLANKLGRLDPKTGAIREYTMKSALTGPHGLAEDKSGNIWFTGNTAGLIGKLDPSSGVVTEYPLPDANARDPHTLNFDQDGILWFTVQQANMIGRLDPATGAIKLLTPPTPRARPYGLKINAQGVPVVVEFGTNKVATVDPKTLTIKEYTLPRAAARPRRLAIGPDGMVWYVDFAGGQLGRLDLATGDVKEWPSPSGAKSEPYGIVFTKGALWYSESAAKPNTIVRFDPATEKFQSWAIPGGGDIVRNMDVTPDGNPVIADSLTNQVGLVEIK
ncbi:cytochrome C [Bradyrhizobium sp. KBS0727]|uniref:Vgb family protein n=1 Tax=unclassified Bradyrhizobium TaxID=2631580 RepID=UPI00110E3BA2|nr:MULTISPECIES: cytochrome C [unclassified Bradyrhizobium]QDW39718.1 cytochrome C [Bradyrhizobium sp. KBS0725]QDW46321.1 cytochrome C [Bradyrhizobium sp. KBS0727]